MSKATAVLYDHPGPKARLRNNVLSAIFLVLLALGAWWMIATLDIQGAAPGGTVEAVPDRRRCGPPTCCRGCGTP